MFKKRTRAWYATDCIRLRSWDTVEKKEYANSIKLFFIFFFLYCFFSPFQDWQSISTSLHFMCHHYHSFFKTFTLKVNTVLCVSCSIAHNLFHSRWNDLIPECEWCGMNCNISHSGMEEAVAEVVPCVQIFAGQTPILTLVQKTFSLTCELLLFLFCLAAS